jgi:glyoxylate reductase
MARIVVVRPIPEEALALLRPRADVVVGPPDPPVVSPDEMRSLVADAEVLYMLPVGRVDASVVDAAPKLRMIATLATGYDSIDVSAARARGIPVTYAPGILDETTADGAFGLLLATARRFGEAERYLRAGRFRGWTPFMFLGQDVHHATLGIVGMGRIGGQMTRRAKGFEMRVLYYDERRNDRAERDLGVTYAALDRLLAESDFVSLHVPLMPSTLHLIDSAALRKMKPTAVLINTSRGPVVDERALAEALRDGVIAAAGLDVLEREPEVEPLLLELENVVLLPHVASASAPTRTRMAVRAAQNILAFLDGKPLLDPVP